MSLNTSPTQRAPSLRRRLACLVYEGVLLFGVVMIAGYLFSALTHQTHALRGREALQAFLFLVLGIYFGWFWSRSGQTVAMRAWHIRLVDVHGQPVGQGRAVARYLASYVWFLPALASAAALHWADSGTIFGWMALWALVYAGLTRLHPERQYWHDVLCGTRLIDWRPAPPART
ncbi:RDD family protein [Ideonella sp. 4Y16]|uniref:RDD family protein n=1 Tax=Ideonella alba TaxID=2824118 RepID=A0A940YGC1_9BURK|nr:RDD family protein [Ideonella alba]MBQ0931977.1 RDD family protein [Ideonella alba]MBQ0942514.1 RDD family protein [Ideonella alba]